MSALSHQRSEARPLTGREHEMSVLGAAVADCTSGTSTVVEITGDPGLGKSRMLDELGDLARAEGLTVLSGRASEFELQRSFGAFTEPVRGCVGRLTERRHETLDVETAALLDLVLPRAVAPQDGPPRPSGVERYRLHHAFGRLLADADRGRGVLLCLDDLHWADEGSVELLHHLLRQPPRTALILACAHRPRQAPAKLLASFPHAAAGYRTVGLPLAPLDRRSCHRLLGTVHTPAQREQLFTVSGGNPLYLEVLSELTDEGATDFTDLPATLRAALAREIALLTADELAVLRAAAVLGDPFDPILLAAVSGLATGPALEALDVLSRTDLIRSCRSPGPQPEVRRLLQFRHPLLREVVSGETPPGWRLAANARADEALRRSGAGTVERAPYVARAAEMGDTEAVRVLTDAAMQTVHSAPATGAAWLRAALYLSVPDDSEESVLDRLGMLLGLANAYGVTGDLASCRDTLGQALDLVPSDRPDRRIPIVALRSIIERIIGSIKVSETVLEDELNRWPPTDARANPLRLQLATTRVGQGKTDEADNLLDALLADTPAPDRRTLTSAAACRALGAAYSGRVGPLRAYATEAATAIDLMEDQELATFLDEVGQLGWAEVLADCHHDAIRHMARGIRVARLNGQSYMVPYLLLCQSYAQQATGDLAGGIGSAADAEEMAHLLDRPDLIGYALALRAAATALRESPAAAVEAAERAVHSVGRRGRLWELSTAVLASVRLDQGRPDDCLDLLRTITGSNRSVTTHALRAMWYCTATQAEMARGDVAAARDWAQHATEAAEAVRLPGQSGYAALATGCVQDEDPAAAAALFAAAADSFAEGGLAPAEGRARLLLGRALASAGQDDQAAAAIGRAKQIADTLGAAHLGALTVNAQRRLGARRPRPGRSRVADRTLSEQERHISDMVARGMSNRAIATSLFLSVKTVEGHLTRIFRKLGVSSRSALIGALAQFPDTPSHQVSR